MIAAGRQQDLGHKMNNRQDRIAVIIGLLAAIVVATVLLAGKASAAVNPCVAAHKHPHSATAAQCRTEGWVVKRRIVVSPNAIVRYSSLPHCHGPVSVSCTWNVIFSRDLSVCDGDCYRAPYWADRHGQIHFVYGTRQRKELRDPYYDGCPGGDTAYYCGIVGPDEEDRTP